MTGSGYAAVVLAGDRGAGDPIARHTGTDCKALSPVAGVPLLWRVLRTLQRVPALTDILVVGPQRSVLDAHPELAEALHTAGVTWIEPAGSPVASAATGLQRLAPETPVLLTTADHALLAPEMIEALLAGGRDRDLAVAMTTYNSVRNAYPNTRRTALRLGPGAGYCGCNLFLINNADGRRLVAEWRRVEAERKHPARMIVRMLGWAAVLRYALGRLSLQQALERLSTRTGVRVGSVLLEQPEAAIDVDSVEDLELVESIIARRDRRQ